ncbi:hypothetical protein Trco_000099 [Trichoderma cornu-damae]|uniref:Uncharacterized protein n=1 Tax=Trichoderma cornu-damae TaxID=654480 RepID=A0A9P8QRR3_9HYPO|nr:hypothetical protein Trco_000099 [Trichoderma cornu-damae]
MARRLVISAASASPYAKCYYPNGKPEQNFNYNYQPCGGRNTTWQQCCIPGQDVCTENGLCTHLTNDWAGAYDYRAGCVNEDWSACPQVCLDVLSNSWLQVKQCATGEYCCNPDFDHGDCCRDGSRRFSLLDRNPDADNAQGAGGSGDPGGKNATGSSGGRSGGGNEGNTSTQTDGGKPEGGNGSGSGSGAGARIGAAVGGTLGGVAAIGAAVGLWLFLRRGRIKAGDGTGSSGTVESLAMKQAYDAVAEAEARPAVAELDSAGRAHELAG